MDQGEKGIYRGTDGVNGELRGKMNSLPSFGKPGKAERSEKISKLSGGERPLDLSYGYQRRAREQLGAGQRYRS